MTKSEFQELQTRAASSGMTLKSFLQAEGVAYSTYNYWGRKMKAESETLPIAPISLRIEPQEIPETGTGISVPGVNALATCDFIRKGQSVLITGPSGTGKSYIASALGTYARLAGFRVLYMVWPGCLKGCSSHVSKGQSHHTSTG